MVNSFSYIIFLSFTLYRNRVVASNETLISAFQFWGMILLPIIFGLIGSIYISVKQGMIVATVISSIESQKKIISDYAESIGAEIVEWYEDDNISGYGFNRPGFNALLKDIDYNKIDMVIAKDLSRIGRHNAQTLLFIKDVKKKAKRIIAIGKEGKNRAYICGTYNQIGKGEKGCTTHYVLDNNLKAVIRETLKRVRHGMQNVVLSLNKNVEDSLKTQQNIDASIHSLERDIKLVSDELKVLISQKNKQLAKYPDNTEDIEATYDEMKKDKLQRINILKTQLEEMKEIKIKSGELEKMLRLPCKCLMILLTRRKLNEKIWN